MIKRIIASLTICLIITGFIDPVFSDASALPQPNWSDPGISEIINISDLTGWMLNGGTYDVSTYTDAESFMNDYYAGRTQTRLEGSDYVIKSSFGLEQQYYQVGDSAYAHPLDVNRVISSSFRDHSGYGRRLSNEVNDALLSSGNLYDTKIPLLSDIEFANFVGYNHDALKFYSSIFDNIEPDPGPTVNPDPNYVQYINNINDTGFWFKNYSTAGKMTVSSPSDVSWIADPSWNQFQTYPTSIYYIYADDIITLNIAGTGNNYSFSYHYTARSAQNGYFIASNSYGRSMCTTISNGSFQPIGNYPAQPLDYWFSSTGNLGTIFSYIQKWFRNVNIYVNGEPWSLVEIPIDPTITPEFPDAVGGEELSNTTWPIFRPRAPYYTNVPGVLQAIEDAIADDGKLDIDDLKPYLTDENGDPVPDPEFDPEPVPIPVPDPVNPDVVPGLPVLPAIPPEMPGFNGVSVLAEIINFTNQSLPTALIVTFWGIVFGIVIIGLIKILHK